MVTAIPENWIERIHEVNVPTFIDILEQGEIGFFAADEGRRFAIQNVAIPLRSLRRSRKSSILNISEHDLSLLVPDPDMFSLATQSTNAPTRIPGLAFVFSRSLIEDSLDCSNFPSWLSFAMSLEERGSPDKACQVIFSEMDNLLSSGDFEKCNEILRSLKVESVSINIITSMLRITLHAHEKLPARQILYSNLYRLLENDPLRDQTLLGLLKPTEWHESRFY